MLIIAHPRQSRFERPAFDECVFVIEVMKIEANIFCLDGNYSAPAHASCQFETNLYPRMYLKQTRGGDPMSVTYLRHNVQSHMDMMMEQPSLSA